MKTLSKLLLLAILLALGCKSDDNNQSDPTDANLQALGKSAEDLLTADTYTRLVIDLVYAEGYRPEEASIANLEGFLQERLQKPEGISITETEIAPQESNPFSISRIREIESEHRTLYNNEQTISVFILFINGNSDNDTDTRVTLGTAYRNTSMVVYEETLRNLSSDFNISLTDLQTTTLHHEFGHLMGLVNIQSDDIHTSHEDENSEKHCQEENCLMYYQSAALKSHIVSRARKKSGIVPLDTLCIEDLQAKGGK